MKLYKSIGIVLLLIGIILQTGFLFPLSTQIALAADQKPTVTTLNANGITQTAAVLRGQVNPNGVPTSYWFEYGTTTSLGKHTSVQAGGTSSSPAIVVTSVSGLSAGSLYYFRVVAQNQYGRSDGTVISFSTTPVLENTNTGDQSNESNTGNTNDSGTNTDTNSGGGSISDITPPPIISYEPVFNNDTTDFPTLRTSNHTTNPGSSSDWGLSTQAQANDVVSFLFYYHNNGIGTARNTRISLSFDTNPITGTIRASGKLWADNASLITGYSTVNVQGGPAQPWSMVYDSIVWYPNQSTQGTASLLNNQTGSSIVNPNGILLGDITGGLSSQGSVVVRFKFLAGNTASSVPSVTTLSASNVSVSSAMFHADLDPKGIDTSYWFEYGTTQALGQRTVTQNTSISQTVSAVVSDLIANGTYYYRAVARNSFGTTNGSIVQVTLVGQNGDTATQPTVISQEATNITQSNATLTGQVNANGLPTSYWFEYGTTQSLGLRTAVQASGSDSTTRSVAAIISGLSAGTQYYYRLAAENSKGRSYGSISSFSVLVNNNTGANTPTTYTNQASAITVSSAQLNGSANAGGVAASYWFEYGTTQSLGLRTAIQAFGSGTSTSAIVSTISGLSAGTQYYYRAVVENSKGRAYGSVIPFLTLSSASIPIAPNVHTDQPSAIHSYDALLAARVNTNGIAGSYWFEYGTTQSLGWRTAIQAIQSSSLQSALSTISGLSASTQYCYRVVAQNSVGRTSGDIICFTTLAYDAGIITVVPSAYTDQTSLITDSSAQLNGTVNAGNLSTSYWFEYGTTQSLGLRTATQSISGSLTQKVFSIVSGLSASTQYCYRVVAQNEKGRVNGDVICFTTEYTTQNTTAPTLQTIVADSISAHTVRLNAQVNAGNLSTSYWFEYGTTQSLGLRTATQSISGSVTQDVSSYVSDLTPLTTYYYRIAARNSKGTVYGSLESFQTLSNSNQNIPIVTTSNATAISPTTATLQATVNANGYTGSYWFEYGTATATLTLATPHVVMGAFVTPQAVSYALSGLTAGTTYYFRVAAQNIAGTATGTILSFTTTQNGGGGGPTIYGGGGGGGARGPLVQTDNSSYITLTEATLYGSLLPNGNNAYGWFEYGISKDNLNRKTIEQSIAVNSDLVPFNATIHGLEAGATYYFRAAGRNDTATSYGQTLSLATFGTAAADKLPIITTKAPTFVSQNSGLVNATVNPKGNDTVTWFEYGTTAALGSRTPQQKVGSGTVDAQISYALTGLTPHTTYFYRAAAKNSYGTVYGYILAINTTVGTITGTVDRTTTVVTTSATNGTASSCILVAPVTTPEQMNAGEDFTYVLTYRNGCSYDLNSVFLKVVVPIETEITAQSSSRGTYEQDTNSVTYALGTLAKQDQGVVTVQGKISTGVNKGDVLIFSSILNYTDTQKQPQSITSYLTAHVLSGRTLTASVFDAFKGLFQSGWFSLFLLLIVGFLIYWIFFRRNGNTDEVSEDTNDVLKA